MISDDDLGMLDLATEEFERALRGDGAIGSAPSRCEGWSTREVANHVLGGAVRYTLYFSGADPVKIAESRTADHLGDDAVESHRTLSAALRKEFVEHRDDGIVLPHLIADVDAPTLLVMRVQELVLHSWDIVSVFEPDMPLDPALCRFLLDRGSEVRAMLRSHGALGPVSTSADTTLTARVLAEWGRI